MVLFTFYNVKIACRVKKGIKLTQLKTSSLNFVKLLIFLPVKCEMAVFPLMKRDPTPPPFTLIIWRDCMFL